MKIRKANLTIFFSYLSLATEEKYRYARLKLDEKAYYWWKIIIDYVDIDFSCKVFFVLGMLCTFIQ